MSWGAMLGPIAGAAAGMFMGDLNRRKQVQQQRELNEVNEESAKNMGRFNYEQSMRMLKETGPKFQVGQLKEAGMSVGNMYGGTGSGGAIQNSPVSMSPGNAEGASAGTGAMTQMGMLGTQVMAQTKLLDAQKENVEADTANKLANAPKTIADTENVKEVTRGTKFENDLRSLFIDNEQDTRKAELDARKDNAEKTTLDTEAWKAAAFKEGKLRTDGENPIIKTKGAEFEKAVTDLKNAKTQGNLMEAQKAVEQFKATMAGMGISPDSPWYLKTLITLGNKVGIKLN